MFGMFIITISTCKINSSNASHVYKDCLTYQAKRLQANYRRRLHNDLTKHLVPLLQELVCHLSAG